MESQTYFERRIIHFEDAFHVGDDGEFLSAFLVDRLVDALSVSLDAGEMQTAVTNHPYPLTGFSGGVDL